MLDAEFFDQHLQMGVIVEDDGQVAYAYLCEQSGKIRGLVWLWNSGSSPESIEGKRGEPVRNPRPNLISLGDSPATTEAEVNVTFVERDGKVGSLIFLRDRLLAMVEDGMFPGRNVNVAKDSPLALPWPQMNEAVRSARFEIENWLNPLSDPESYLYGASRRIDLVSDLANDLDEATTACGALTFDSQELSFGQELAQLVSRDTFPSETPTKAADLLALMRANDRRDGIDTFNPRPIFPVRLDGISNPLSEGEIHRARDLGGLKGVDSIGRTVAIVEGVDGFDAQLG